MVEGSTIDVRGPIGNFKYSENQHSHIVMLAAGTGITPMFQIIQELLGNEAEKTRLTLVYQVFTLFTVGGKHSRLGLLFIHLYCTVIY